MIQLASLLLALPLQGPGLAGPGISRELAVHRARTVSDGRYELALDVTPLDSAIGEVTVRWKRGGTGDVILDFRGRRLQSISVNGRPILLTAFNGAHVILPAAALTSGE